MTRKDGQSPEKIIFKVAAKRAGYVSTKPFHSSQPPIERSDNQVAVFEITGLINIELVSLLLSFDSELVVMEPNSLKDKISTELNLAIGNYTSGSK